MTKKIFLLACVLVLFNFAVSESPLNLKNKVKDLLATSFSTLLGAAVDIGALEGDLYKNIVLRNVKITDNNNGSPKVLLYTDKIEINYDLKGFLLDKLDFLPNIKKVKIYQPYINVDRDRKGFWPLQENFAVKTDTSAEFNPQGLNLKLEIVGGRVKYRDARGWGDDVVAKTFETELRDFAGIINIKNEDLQLAVVALLPGAKRYNNITFKGNLDLINYKYNFEMNTEDIDLSKWVWYTAPFPEWDVNKGSADLQIFLSNTQGGKQIDNQYRIVARVSRANFLMPSILKKETKNIYGKVTVDNQSVVFNDIKGLHETLPVTLNGRLIIADKDLADMRLKLAVAALPLLKINDYLPEIPVDLPIVDGIADLVLSLSGAPHKIKIAGEIVSEKVIYQKHVVKELVASFDYANLLTKINIENAKIFKGGLKGNLALKFIDVQGGKLSLQGNGAFQLEDILASALTGQEQLAGSFSGDLFFDMVKEKTNIIAIVPSASLLVYEQKINSFNVNVVYTPTKTSLEKIELVLNGEPVALKGWVNKDNFKLTLKDQLVAVVAKSPLKFYENNINFSGMVSGEFAGELKAPENITADLQLKLTRLPLFYEFIDRGNLNLKIKDKRIDVSNAELFFANSYLAFDFSYDILKKDLHLSLAPGSKVDLTDITFLQELAPNSRGLLVLAGEFGFFNGRPRALAELELKNFDYNEIVIDNVKTELLLTAETLALNKVVIGFDQSSVKGAADWRVVLNSKNDTEQFVLNGLKIKTEDVHLAKLQQLLTVFSKEADSFDKKIKESSYFKKVTLAIQPRSFALNKPLYQEDQKNNILTDYLLFTALPQNKQQESDDLLDGTLNGVLELANKDKKWAVLGQWNVSQGKLFKNNFANLQVDIKTDQANKIVGEITLLDLTIAEKVNYQKISGQLEYDAGVLNVKGFDLESGSYFSPRVLTGSFPLAAFWDDSYLNAPLNLQLNLKSEDLRLFLGFWDSVSDLTGEGELALRLRGTFANPELSADKIELAGLTIYLKNAFYPELKIKRADLLLAQNKLQINNLELFLTDQATNATPVFKLFGSSKLLLSGFDQKSFAARADISLFAKDMVDTINLKDLYMGDFYLKNLKMAGSLFFGQPTELALLPTLSGQIGLSRGEIYFKKLDNKSSPLGELALLPLDLKLELNNSLRLKSDASMLSAEALNVVSQVDLALAPRGSSIEIKGTFGKPLLDGAVFFEEGQISLFYRRFILLNKDEQQRYFSIARHLARENQIEFKTDENGNFSQRVFVVAQSVVLESAVAAAAVVTGDMLVSENQQTEDGAVKKTFLEKEYLAIIDGSLVELSSFSFEKYGKENNRYVLEGEPYILKNKETGEEIDPYRFQLLMVDLAPSLLKSAYAYASGSGDYEQGTKEATREFMISQGAVVWRYFMRPVERSIADSTGLYDVRITRDLSSDAARLLSIEEHQYLNEAEEPIFLKGENIIGFELVHEVLPNKLYMSIDTDIDRNTRLKSYNLMVNSYNLTWKIVRNLFLDEISLNVGNEYDYYQRKYKPVLSLEALHSF